MGYSIINLGEFMRLRNVKNAKEIIENGIYVVQNPKDYKGIWNTIFKNDNPIHIEIGMGKGRFILEHAKKYPNINFIGIEKFDSVIVKAIKLTNDEKLSNLKLLRIDALELDEVFDHEVDQIYLNFSDPWPKDKHAKRRLTSSIFLKLYESICKGDILITQKTDNELLYEFSSEEYVKQGFSIQVLSFNKETMSDDNIMTEYENKFLNQGNTIYQIKACKEMQ